MELRFSYDERINRTFIQITWKAIKLFLGFWVGYKLPQCLCYNLACLGLYRHSEIPSHAFTLYMWVQYHLALFGFKRKVECECFWKTDYTFPIFEWYRRWMFWYRSAKRH